MHLCSITSIVQRNTLRRVWLKMCTDAPTILFKDRTPAPCVPFCTPTFETHNKQPIYKYTR